MIAAVLCALCLTRTRATAPSYYFGFESLPVNDRSESVAVLSKIFSSGTKARLERIGTRPWASSLAAALEGWRVLVPHPDLPLLAIVHHDAASERCVVDIWSVKPFALRATIPAGGVRRAEWLPGSRLLSLVEERDGRFDVELLDERGNQRGFYTNTFRAVSDPEAGRLILVRYPNSYDQLPSSLRESTAMPSLVRRIDEGRISFECLNMKLSRTGILGPKEAIRTLIGNGTAADLFLVLNPYSKVVGFARHWLVPEAKVEGYEGPGALRRVVDVVGYPRAQYEFRRLTTNDETETNLWLGSDGSIRFSGTGDTDVRHRAREGEKIAISATKGVRKAWAFPTKQFGGVALWDNALGPSPR